MTSINLDKSRIVAIIGDMNTGKTNLAVYLMRNYKGIRQIYTLGYPKKIDQFPALYRTQDIERVSDSIIFIDELSRFFPLKQRHSSKEFLDVSRLLAHRNNTIIFTTQLSQDLTMTMESFVDTFLITRISDLRFLKKGSKVKTLVLDCCDYHMTGKLLDLVPGQYLQFTNDSMPGEDGVKTFEFQNIHKDWNINIQSTGIQSINEKVFKYENLNE